MTSKCTIITLKSGKLSFRSSDRNSGQRRKRHHRMYPLKTDEDVVGESLENVPMYVSVQ